MRARRITTIAGCTLSLALGLVACAGEQPLALQPLPPVPRPVVADEGPNAHWIGHSSLEIVAMMGQPDLVLETTPIGSAYTATRQFVSYVYRSADDGYACAEAFVVDRSTAMVVDYHCH